MKEFLVENLDDVYESRATEWIFTDENRCNLALNLFPRILIKSIDTQNERLAVGTTNSIDTAKIQIKVKCLFGNKYSYDNREYTGEELSVILIEKISNLVKNNHPKFVEAGFLYCYPNGGPMKEFDNNKNITGVATFDTQYVN